MKSKISKRPIPQKIDPKWYNDRRASIFMKERAEERSKELAKNYDKEFAKKVRLTTGLSFGLGLNKLPRDIIGEKHYSIRKRIKTQKKNRAKLLKTIK